MLRDFPSVEKTPASSVNEFGAHNPKSAISDVRSLAPVYLNVDQVYSIRRVPAEHNAEDYRDTGLAL